MTDIKAKRKRDAGILAFAWALIAALFMGGAAFAWFTFTSYTNVSPMAGTIGEGGAELLISNSPDGVFSDSAQLILDSAGNDLQPVSTANLENYFVSVGQDGKGISTRFKEITEDAGKMMMSGSLYLKSEGKSCRLYLDENSLYFGEDAQFLASGRLGLKIHGGGVDAVTYIFKLDDAADTSGAEETVTTDETDAVISGVGGSGEPEFVKDPAYDLSRFMAHKTRDDTAEAASEHLCVIPEGAVVTVDYMVYIEGCDVNSCNEIKEKEMSLKLGFIGIEQDDLQ